MKKLLIGAVIIFSFSIFAFKAESNATDCNDGFNKCVDALKAKYSGGEWKRHVGPCKDERRICNCLNNCSNTKQSCITRANRSRLTSRRNRLRNRCYNNDKSCRNRCK